MEYEIHINDRKLAVDISDEKITVNADLQPKSPKIAPKITKPVKVQLSDVTATRVEQGGLQWQKILGTVSLSGLDPSKQASDHVVQIDFLRPNPEIDESHYIVAAKRMSVDPEDLSAEMEQWLTVPGSSQTNLQVVAFLPEECEQQAAVANVANIVE